MRFIRLRAAVRCICSMRHCSRNSRRCLPNIIPELENGFLKTRFTSRALCNVSAAVSSAIDGAQLISERQCGVLLSGEIMPGVTTDEIALRRKKLISQLPKESLVIINSATVKQMSDVVPYPFRQNADYLYYTGCQHSGGIAVVDCTGELYMFMPDPDPEREAWEGHVSGIVEAINILKADHAYNLSHLSEILPRMIKRSKGIYVDNSLLGDDVNKLLAFQEAVRHGKVHNLQKYTHEDRWIKSASEINLMRHSAAIACQAFLQTMKISRTWSHEHILAATIEYECKIKGAQRMAFPPVVGGGVNGTIIHYSQNDQWVRAGEMVLLDAGCEYYGYVSDITRTWSPSGDISAAQSQIYEIVLSNLKACLEICKPGVTLREIHDYSADLLFGAATDLGIIHGAYRHNWQQTPQLERYLRINPTAIGHYLGMDVHDCSSVSKGRKLEPGVIITIEPGLYIPVRDDIPKRFRGIGVRIEEEVLITDSSYEVLTASIPKELNQIDAWLQS